jgi:hypothetical protein
MAKTIIKGKWIKISRHDPSTLPPKDGTWIEARLYNGDRIALQFDKSLARWFNGKNHAVKEDFILSWFKVEEASPC